MTDEDAPAPREAKAHDFDDEFVSEVPIQEHLDITDLSEVSLELSADLGRCTVQVRDIRDLKVGAVLPMDKLAGEMADVYVNGVPFARGEVVVLVDSLHVRVAEVIGATDKDLGYA
jgi:flagellar motor switch protein FliN